MNPQLDAKSLTDALRRYAVPFENHPPEILKDFKTVFPFEASSDKGLGILLLSAAVYRPGGEAAAARLITGLYRRFRNDIFKLNRTPFEAVRDEIDGLNVVGDDNLRIPGILRSVCDFFYRVGPLGPWLASAPDWEMRVIELCGEIYWMGRQSLLRNKARYFLWLASFQPGLIETYPQARNFSWPVGEGHLRFYVDFLKPPRGKNNGSASRMASPALDAQRRLDTFRDLARMTFPEAPWRLFAPLDAYLRRGGALQYRCRSIQGGCRPCPLASGCPASAYFIPTEV